MSWSLSLSLTFFWSRYATLRYKIWDLGLTSKRQRQNLGLWDKIGTFLGPFEDLVAIFMKIWYYIAKLTQEEKGFKKHVVATLSAKSGLFEDLHGTFRLYIDVHGRTCLIKYLKLYLMLYQTTLMASEDLIY